MNFTCLLQKRLKNSYKVNGIQPGSSPGAPFKNKMKRRNKNERIQVKHGKR